MGTLYEDVFLGLPEKYNQKLEILSKMAQPEKWTYKKIQEKDPYRILRNYVHFTYNRVEEESKFVYSIRIFLLYLLISPFFWLCHF